MKSSAARLRFFLSSPRRAALLHDPRGLRTMGAVEMGVPEEELSLLVERWRRANPNIVRFWWDVDAAARGVVRKVVPDAHG